MNYKLNKTQNGGMTAAAKRLLPFLKEEKAQLATATVAIIVNAVSTLLAPVVIGYAVDHFIQNHDFHGVLVASATLFVLYLLALGSGYLQTISMGSIGRRVLFRLRNAIFLKLQELPVAFFNQNKTGDLISRINNDTDQLNQFFSQALMQFMRNFFLIVGAGIFLLTLDLRLGAAALTPAVSVFIVTQLISGWVKHRNLLSLQSLGGMSAEVQESLTNFKVIVAFNRLDYFRTKFGEANEKNFGAAVRAGYANNLFNPIYFFASSAARVIVLMYGITLIGAGHLTIGLLISFLLYVDNFYMPLQQIASVWATFQQSLAAMDRISEVLTLSTDMPVLPAEPEASNAVIEFRNVHFRYPAGKEVLTGDSFALERGKEYALVGPTGGGKTTTASLMARLYDPTEGCILLGGKDIRSYTTAERADKIGFILQEPFLFTGTLLDNIFYGHPTLGGATTEQRMAAIKDAGLDELLQGFSQGLDVEVQTSGETISLGQRQLIAFVRAVLRKPEILILDEATANIDTVTEQLLQAVLEKLPTETTKVVIAHRLNTIENADEIFFVNAGGITPAGSLEHAVDMLMHHKRAS